jgi:hypothetical protein
VRGLTCVVVSAVLVAQAASAPAAYSSAQRKLDLIQDDRAPANAVYSFNKTEIEAWAAAEIPELIPEGFRDARIELGTDVAVGRGYIDFMKLRHAKGAPKNWFLDKLLQGERPVSVTVKLQSANGMCTVILQRLEISGVAATGSVLDFLLKNFFLTLFPDAKVGEPFALRHRMESVTVRPLAVYVKIKNEPPPAPAVAPPPAPAKAAPKAAPARKK